MILFSLQKYFRKKIALFTEFFFLEKIYPVKKTQAKGWLSYKNIGMPFDSCGSNC
jgi:hypothetical protein